jgi:predicted RNA binding protein YcfA (HicA-like mRNA interferase family)
LVVGAPSAQALCDEASKGNFVPQKIRELVAELERADFVNRGGKGSHRNFVHPRVSKPITISGALGDDAKHYQVRAVKYAIEESKS